MASVSKRSWVTGGETRTAWVVRYVDREGKRRMQTFDLKRDADKYRMKVEGEVEQGTHVAARASITVSKLVDQFLEAAESRNREGRKMGDSRLNVLTSVGRNHVKPHLGRMLLVDLTFSDVEAWAATIGKVGKLSPGTVSDYLHALRGMIDFAMKRGFVAKNVVRDVLKERGNVPRSRIGTFSKDDALKLLQVAAVRPPGHHHRRHALLNAYIHLAAFCGLRVGEIHGLTMDSPDFAERFIRVRNNLTRWDVLKGPKTAAGVRDVPMPAHVSAMLQEWVRLYYVPNDRGLIFRVEGGNLVSHSNFLIHSWRPLLARAGLTPTGGKGWLHFHALRHFAASLMIENGLPLTDTAQVLGHERFDMTLQTYAHPIVTGHRRLAAVERMAGDMMNLAHPLPLALGD